MSWLSWKKERACHWQRNLKELEAIVLIGPHSSSVLPFIMYHSIDLCKCISVVFNVKYRLVFTSFKYANVYNYAYIRKKEFLVVTCKLDTNNCPIWLAEEILVELIMLMSLNDCPSCVPIISNASSIRSLVFQSFFPIM